MNTNLRHRKKGEEKKRHLQIGQLPSHLVSTKKRDENIYVTEKSEGKKTFVNQVIYKAIHSTSTHRDEHIYVTGKKRQI